jgi:plastocyanin
MLRRTLLALAATTLIVFAVPAIPALAGGGCHAGVTTGDGDTVEMSDACFTPTSLHIEPGDAVTFVNRDPITHNVGGNLWGHLEDMARGDAFTATFDDAGVFPYACSYHPGMTGVIVVGSAVGAGNGERVDVAPFVAAEPVPATTIAPDTTLAAATTPLRETSSPAIGWIAAGAAGLALGLGVGLFARRRPGTPSSEG